MKKLFLMFVVMLALIICLCGCLEIDPNADDTIPQVQASVEKNTVKRPTVPHSLMEASTIVVKKARNTDIGKEVVLEGDAKDEVLSILNNSGWINAALKFGASHQFTIGETSIGYASDVGVFLDLEEGMSLELSKEQRLFINSLLGE
jgi:hypothetical protein